MKQQVMNPYLPFWETIPDGEPHVFGDRLYIFGSHDRIGGTMFCPDDYVTWSCPVEDLSDWRYEGVIYKKSQDPINGAPYHKPMPECNKSTMDGRVHRLYAPDVAQGPDGRYYLFYSMDSSNLISVAVCDTPAGEYQFLDYVTYADGSVPLIGRLFDPAVLVEESGNYLYYGFAPANRSAYMIGQTLPGGMVVRLADDMHTIISEPTLTANGCDTSAGTDYEAHPFFEASSIRHYGDWYYFVYSSQVCHELCYGMAKNPEGPFTFKGVLHSNGDLGVNGNTLRTNYTGNNHGGLVKVGEDYYIFAHRQTHGTAYSRQGVAEKITMNPDGTFNQVEQTSCGLNGGPLKAEGTYLAHIACHLTGPDRAKVGDVPMANPVTHEIPTPADAPYITEEPCEQAEHGLRPYIYNLLPGAMCGFRYFDFGSGGKQIAVTLRGCGSIALMTAAEGQTIAAAAFDSPDWTEVTLDASRISGVSAVYMRVVSGKADLAQLRFV